MKSKLLVSVVLVFCGLSATGRTKIDLDAELIKDEWIGAQKFADELNSAKVDSCKFILENNKKFLDTSLAIRRILLIAEKTKCIERSHLVSFHLNSSDFLLKASAIRLAATLNNKEKQSFRKQIIELQKVENDPAVKEAISKFMQD